MGTLKGVVIALVWTQLYAWWTAIVFGSLFNLFGRTGRK